MGPGESGSITVMLAGAVVSMAGFIVWLFRFVISTQNDRIKKLETEQADAINTNTKAVNSNTETLKELLGITQRLGDIFLETAPRHQYRAVRPSGGGDSGGGGGDE